MEDIHAYGVCDATNGITLPLMYRIQQGDQLALGQIYDLMVAKVYGLALRILLIHADAEEVTCDVFHQVWRNAKQFDGARGNPTQWIMMIARSRAIDRYRDRQPSRCEVNQADTADSIAMHGATECSDALENFDIGSSIYIALMSLKPVQMELIAMAFFQGLTHQEIADRKQLPLGTVKSHLTRAAAALRKKLRSSDSTISMLSDQRVQSR